MTPFSNRRSKRTTAIVAVLAWAFAMASGVANACLLDAPKAISSFSISAAHHDGDSRSPKAPCLKACDEGSHSLPAQSSSLDLDDPGAAVVGLVVWRDATQVASVSGSGSRVASPLSGPPIRTRFPRLTV